MVLDLGSGSGSFPAQATAALVIRLDREFTTAPLGGWALRGDAASVPLRDGSIAAVIANHSLEHIENLTGALREIRRVLRPDGALFVSVPDANTLTDRLYRWLSRGGGHVNPFTAAEDLSRLISLETGLRHVWTATLCSSLSFLNRRNSPVPRPRRLLLLGGGATWTLLLYTWLSRRLDRLAGTRTSIYGWAFYFGQVAVPVRSPTKGNVCIQCGGSTSGASLLLAGKVYRRWAIRFYRCPVCLAENIYSPDRTI